MAEEKPNKSQAPVLVGCARGFGSLPLRWAAAERAMETGRGVERRAGADAVAADAVAADAVAGDAAGHRTAQRRVVARRQSPAPMGKKH